MDGRPFNYLEHAARERQRTLIAEAQRLAMARLAAGDARSGWRSAVAAFGRALARVGRRLEALEDVRGAGPASAPRRWGRPPARPPGPAAAAPARPLAPLAPPPAAHRARMGPAARR